MKTIVIVVTVTIVATAVTVIKIIIVVTVTIVVKVIMVITVTKYIRCLHRRYSESGSSYYFQSCNNDYTQLQQQLEITVSGNSNNKILVGYY